MKRRTLRRIILLAGLIILAVVALDQRLILRRYTVETGRFAHPVRMAVLTDYHGCDYGENGAQLVAAVAALEPDVILMVGDMFSADGDPTGELAMMRSLSAMAGCYYVTGNHEYWEYHVPGLLTQIRQAGVTVLSSSCATIDAGGARLNLCGIPDPYAGDSTESCLAQAAAPAEPDAYTVLLAHRPELIGKYAETGDFDLVLSGHAHGGQVRIPLLINGLVAPNQGLFPAYAGGAYHADGTAMIVSRGLSTQAQMGVPRIFNRPELLLVELH